MPWSHSTDQCSHRSYAQIGVGSDALQLRDRHHHERSGQRIRRRIYPAPIREAAYRPRLRRRLGTAVRQPRSTPAAHRPCCTTRRTVRTPPQTHEVQHDLHAPDAEQLTSVYGEPIEEVPSFCYLGSIIAANGSVTEEVAQRIAKARAAYAMLHPMPKENERFPKR